MKCLLIFSHRKHIDETCRIFEIYREKKIYIENINTVNYDMAMSVRLDFIYYISNTVELSLATLKVALQNVLCVAQRGKLQNLLR